MRLKTSFSATNAQFSSKSSAALAIGKLASHPRENQGQSTRWGSTFWKVPWFLSFVKHYRIIASCRKMIPSILRRPSSRRIISTGGEPPPPPPPRKSRSKFNLWHEVKYFFESKVKPQTTQELLEGIKKFWGRRVTIEKCNNYINDVLFEAIPDVIAAGGRATKHSAFCSLLRTNFSQTAPSGATTASKSQ